MKYELAAEMAPSVSYQGLVQSQPVKYQKSA